VSLKYFPQSSDFVVQQKSRNFSLSTRSDSLFLDSRMKRGILWFCKRNHKIPGGNLRQRLLVKCKYNQCTHRFRYQSPFRLADTEGVTIVATSEDSIDFAHVSFTKNELGLGLGQEIHEIREYKNGLSFPRVFSDIESYKIIGIMKGFTSEAEAPALQLSFTIIGVPKDEVFGGDINDDERVQIGMSILRLQKRINIKHI